MHPTFARRMCAGTLAAALVMQMIPASAIGLMQAYEDALQNDPSYRSAVHDNEAGRQNIELGRSNLLPNVSLSYTTSHNRSDLTEPNFFGTITTSHPNYDSEAGAIQLRQPLLNFDGLARYKQGVAQANYSEAQFGSRKQDLIIRVVGAYADAQYAEYQVALALAQRDAYAEQMKVNERMFQKGEGTRTDVLETKARYDLAEAQLIEAQDNVVVMRNTLAGIVGHEITQLDPLRENFPIIPLKPAGFDDWKAIALANNSDIAAQGYVVEASNQEVNKNRAGHMPRIDFIASVSRGKSETLTSLNQDTSTRSVGFQLNVPIFSGGATQAGTVQAVANAEKAKSDLEAKTSQVLVELRKQYSQTLSSVTRIDALMNSVQSATLLIEATRQSIKGGVRINLDLLNAQQQLYTAKRDLAQARYNYLLSYLRLKNAAGTLTSDDVRSIASYFERGGSVAPAAALSGSSLKVAARESGASVVLKSSAPTVRLAGQKAP